MEAGVSRVKTNIVKCRQWIRVRNEDARFWIKRELIWVQIFVNIDLREWLFRNGSESFGDLVRFVLASRWLFWPCLRSLRCRGS